MKSATFETVPSVAQEERSAWQYAEAMFSCDERVSNIPLSYKLSHESYVRIVQGSGISSTSLRSLEFSANIWRATNRGVVRSELNWLLAAKGIEPGELYKLMYATNGRWVNIRDAQIESVSTGETFSTAQEEIVRTLQDGNWHRVYTEGYVDNVGNVTIKNFTFDHITITFVNLIARHQYLNVANWSSSVTSHWQINASENSDPASIQIWGWKTSLTDPSYEFGLGL